MLIGAISGHDKSKTLADMLLTVMFVQLKNIWKCYLKLNLNCSLLQHGCTQLYM